MRLPHCCLKKWCVPSCGQSQSWTPSQPLDVGQDNPRAGVPSATQVPDIETALKAIQKILPKLEARMIEFLAEWLVTFLIPATHGIGSEGTSSFLYVPQRILVSRTVLYLGLKVTALFDRSESYTRVLDGQVRCITPEIQPQNLQVIWNVQFLTVFVPAWMIPPVYHNLRRESIKNASSASPASTSDLTSSKVFVFLFYFSSEGRNRDSANKTARTQPFRTIFFFSVQRLHGFRQVVTYVQSQQKDEL